MSKIDCYNTINFFKEKERLTKDCKINCEDCPLHRLNNGSGYGCATFISHEPKRAVTILQKWSDENPVKTRLDDFKEKYPNHKKNGDGYPISCCLCLGYAQDCDNECDKCWDMPL